MKKNPRLENWSVIAADPGCFKLQGQVSGHPNPRFEDGKLIQTSILTELHGSLKFAKTKHTTYELGDPDPAFLEYLKGLGKKIEDYNF